MGDVGLEREEGTGWREDMEMGSYLREVGHLRVVGDGLIGEG